MRSIMGCLVLASSLLGASAGSFSVARFTKAFDAYMSTATMEGFPEDKLPATSAVAELAAMIDSAAAEYNDFNAIMPVVAVLRHGPGGKGHWEKGGYDAEVANAQARFQPHSVPLIIAEANLIEKMAYTPYCTSHFMQTSVLEERCVTSQIAYAMMILKKAGQWELSEAMYDRGMAWSNALDFTGCKGLGCQGIGWTSFVAQPVNLVPGLRSKPWWPREEVPLTKLLEDNIDGLRKDARKLMTRRRGKGWDDTYAGLVSDGNWQKLSLYNFKQWDKNLCNTCKFTCNLLKDWVRPDLPQLAPNQDEIVFFMTQPGSTVALHNGGTNARLNVHIGLFNLEGSYIEVAGERRGWSTNESFVFDDGHDHKIVTPTADLGGPSKGPRVVFAFGMTHPDIAADPIQAFSTVGLPAAETKDLPTLMKRIDHKWMRGKPKSTNVGARGSKQDL